MITGQETTTKPVNVQQGSAREAEQDRSFTGSQQEMVPLHEKLLVKDDPDDLRASVDPENLLIISPPSEQIDRFSLTSSELREGEGDTHHLVDSLDITSGGGFLSFDWEVIHETPLLPILRS